MLAGRKLTIPLNLTTFGFVSFLARPRLFRRKCPTPLFLRFVSSVSLALLPRHRSSPLALVIVPLILGALLRLAFLSELVCTFRSIRTELGVSNHFV